MAVILRYLPNTVAFLGRLHQSGWLDLYCMRQKLSPKNLVFYDLRRYSQRLITEKEYINEISPLVRGDNWKTLFSRRRGHTLEHTSGGVESSPSLPVFRQRLKTFLFHKSFPDVV